ncbi:hypothetical protein P8452_08978 [Trifolium repens]|nr:hypothetical protein P8452_08978 [Trifolium repens]
MPALTEIFGDDSVLQFGGGTLGHPWGNAPGAVANRVALEACVQARNEGRDLAREGNEIIRAAAKWSPELAAACEIFGDDSVLQFGGGTLGHPWGNAPGAVANRVTLEACVQARNEGRDLAREGNEIIRAAAKWSPELAAACEVWKEIKFEFPAMDTL